MSTDKYEKQFLQKLMHTYMRVLYNLEYISYIFTHEFEKTFSDKTVNVFLRSSGTDFISTAVSQFIQLDTDELSARVTNIMVHSIYKDTPQETVYRLLSRDVSNTVSVQTCQCILMIYNFIAEHSNVETATIITSSLIFLYVLSPIIMKNTTVIQKAHKKKTIHDITAMCITISKILQKSDTLTFLECIFHRARTGVNFEYYTVDTTYLVMSMYCYIKEYIPDTDTEYAQLVAIANEYTETFVYKGDDNAKFGVKVNRCKSLLHLYAPSTLGYTPSSTGENALGISHAATSFDVIDIV